MLLLRAIAIATAVLTALTTLTTLAALTTLALLPIRRIWLIGILLWRMLLLAAWGWRTLLLSLLTATAAGAIRRHAALPVATTAAGWVLVRALWLALRIGRHISAALAGTLLLVDPDCETTARRSLSRFGRGCCFRGRPGNGSRLARCLGHLAARVAYPWHTCPARGRLTIFWRHARGGKSGRGSGCTRGWRGVLTRLTRRFRRDGTGATDTALRCGRIRGDGLVTGRRGGDTSTARLYRWRVGQQRFPGHLAGKRGLFNGSGTRRTATFRCGSRLIRCIHRYRVIRRCGILAPGSATCRGESFLIFWHKGLLKQWSDHQRERD
jgi:hypothetical protein